MKIKGKRNQREHLKLAKMRRVCKNQKKLLERLKKKLVKNEYNQEKLWKMLKTNRNCGRLWKLKEIVKDFKNQEKMWKMKMVGPHFRFSCDRPQPSRPHSHHSIFCCSPLIEDEDEHWHLDFSKYKKNLFLALVFRFMLYN